MKHSAFIFILLIVFWISSSTDTLAKSSYVLPYPSVMPGGLSYKVHLIWETINQYWYFGDFGQFEYNLKQSDKYLVEAKTLFEYEQFLLGVDSLKKSDEYFKKAPSHLRQAAKNHKDISIKQKELRTASERHVEVLSQMEKIFPEIIHWIPEKVAPTDLPLHSLLYSSIQIRSNYE